MCSTRRVKSEDRLVDQDDVVFVSSRVDDVVTPLDVPLQ